MSSPSPTAPAEPVDLPNALHIVLFGLPAAGKSSLLGALAQAAQAQEHLLNGRLADLSKGLAELRQRLYEETPRRTAEEVVPYPVDYEPFSRGGPAAGGGGHLQVVLLDCDGRVANDLLVRRQALDEHSPEGTLAHEVVEADTLVLVIDAAAPPAQVDADFAEFDRFLRQMEGSRGRRAEVGGLPVFLVLTKCDLLAQPGDTGGDWMERIEERKRDVDARFKAFLSRRQQEAGALPFGQIDLHLWATAVKRPALAGSPAKPREPFGVAELFRQCLEAAAAFHESRRRSGRRLAWTVGGAAGFVALLLSLAVGQALRNSSGPSSLQLEVESVSFRFEKTPAERLRHPSGELRRRLAELEKIRNDPEFSSLPAEQQKHVREWAEELQKYLAYLDRLRAERRPADVTTEQALEAVKDRLQTELALPSPEWQATEAGEIQRDRLKDAEALRKAVGRLRNWYLDAAEKATALWTFKGYPAGPEGPGTDWQAWSREAEQVLNPANKPSWTESEAIPDSPSGLTYGAAGRFNKVAEAKADWEEDCKRLGRLLNLTAALGLATAKDRPAVLVFPRDCTLDLVRTSRQQLRQAYPDYDKEFTLHNLPDAVKPKVRQVARTNYEYVLEPARAVVLEQLRQAGSGPDETPARWEAVRNWLRDPVELAAWRVVAVVLARLADPEAADPVTALHSFLQKSSFTIAFTKLVVEIPDSLKVKPGANATFNVYHPASAGEDRPALVLEQSGDGERQAKDRAWAYSFRLAEGQRITYRPGDRLWATLGLRDDWVLTWARDRSSLYQFERLLRPPRLHKRDEPNTAGSLQEGVRVTFTPADGVPRVPDLMPVVRLGP
jgi:hypothetical protein